MKKHIITYQTITGEKRIWDTQLLPEFFQRLEELMDDNYVVQHSISFSTEEPATDDIKEVTDYYNIQGELREREYNRFKLGK